MSVQLRDGLAFGLQASVVINLYCPTGKSESFTTKKSSWQDVWALRKCSPEISDLLVFCHKEVLPGNRVHMNATQNHSVEWVERLVRVPVFTKFSPWSSKRSLLRYSNGSTKAQKELKLKCSLSPWGSPVNNGNAAIEISNNKSRAVMRHEVKSF